MKKYSIWEENNKTNNIDSKIEENLKTNILIIGCGISGMSVGLELLENNKNFIMIDKGKVGCGVTSKSTGKITYLQSDIYNKIISAYDFETAKTYLDSQRYSIKRLENIVNKYNIDCDLEKVNSYLFTNNYKNLKKLEKEKEFYKKAKIKYKEIEKLPNGYNVISGIEVTDTYVFDPLKYVRALRKIIEKENKIIENITVHNIKFESDYMIVETDRGNIKTKNVVITTHYPFYIFPTLIPFKTYIEKSYIASCKKSIPKMSAITVSKPTLSIRNYKNDNILVSTNSSSTKHNYKKEFNSLIENTKKITDSKINYIWSNHDVMTNDSIPYIDKLKNKNIFIATGYNKWGMSNGILSGKIISDLILNKKNNFKHIFSLNRPFSLKRTMNAIYNNTKVGVTFIYSKIVRNPLYYEYAEVKMECGENIGIYHGKDKDYKVKNTCPHMKCSLIFNEEEHVWECPCHGSSFDIEGNILTGPSNYDIKIK